MSPARQPAPPKQFTQLEHNAFVEIADALREAGVDLQAIDAFLLERATRALLRARDAAAVMASLDSTFIDSRYGVSLHPAAREERSQWDAFVKASNLLGMSPRDRQRLETDRTDAWEDPLDELDRMRRERHLTG